MNSDVKSESRKRLPWNLQMSYEDIYVSTGHLWRLTKSSYVRKTAQSIYHCKNKNLNECEARLRIETDSDGNKIFFTAYSHKDDCTSVHNSDDITLRTAVIEAQKHNLSTAYDIKRFIQEKQMKVGSDLSEKKIYNIIEYEKSKLKKRPCHFTTDDLVSLCSKFDNQKIVDHDSIICNYTISPVQIFFSTTQRVKKLKNVKCLHVDGTYKITDLNYILIVCGFSDLNATFHLTALILVETESTMSYVWALRNLHTESLKLQIDFHPEVLVADCADAITNAKQTVFPQCKRVHCWAHVLRNLKTKIKSAKNKSEEVMEDIYFMQLLFTTNLFTQACELFEDKWTQLKETKLFCEYIVKEYFKTSSNWFEGFQIFAPSTNNCLESFNKTIKSRYLKYKQQTIASFFPKVCEIFNDSDLTKIPIMDKIRYNEPALIAQDSEFIFNEIITFSTETVFLITPRMPEDSVVEQIKDLIYGNFRTFTSFKFFYENNLFLTVDTTIQSFTNVRCSCYHFLKQKKCIHVYNYLKKQNLTHLININLLSAKRSRGRPKKIKKNTCLVKNLV